MSKIRLFFGRKIGEETEEILRYKNDQKTFKKTTKMAKKKW